MIRLNFWLLAHALFCFIVSDLKKGQRLANIFMEPSTASFSVSSSQAVSHCYDGTKYNT